MLHPRLILTLGGALILAGLPVDARGSEAAFPAVPPPSGTIKAPAVTTSPAAPSSSPFFLMNTGFPDVPPPSPSLKTGALPAVPQASPAIQIPPTAALSTEAPAAALTPHEMELKAKKDQQLAQEREAKQKRDLEAAKKSGKAPASAYATPVSLELPKAVAGKEAELQALAARYRASQISPEEYHKKRAELIARP